MKLSRNNLQYYNALHTIFTVDYQQINQYVLDLYSRPKQFIDETGPSVERFLREYTLPGAPRGPELPTGVILDFIGQIDEFTSETSVLFNEHKAHVDQCDKYMQKVSAMQNITNNNSTEEMVPELMDITSELIYVHEGLKRIKEKASSMAERLGKLENRWATMKTAINR
jgi:hypothetical protein